MAEPIGALDSVPARGYIAPEMPLVPSSRAFARFAAVLLGYLLLVIVFGAWVRITGSGAGCGDHWPSCQGAVVPRSPNAATLIEYTHRLTSGVLGLLTVLLPLWAFRSYPAGHGARRWSVCTLLLTAVEAGIGAGLVKAQLVADDASLARAVVVALHLVNTLLLTASAALTVAAARSAPLPAPTRAAASSRGSAELWALGTLLGALALVAASGAVTALGDTLFPVPERGGALLHGSEHFLVQLRVVHPILACVAGCAAVALVRLLLGRGLSSGARPWALALGALSALQLVLGTVNIWLHAPGWLQLLHLLLAQLLWISAVLLTRAVAQHRTAPETSLRATTSPPQATTSPPQATASQLGPMMRP
jgi:heme A synthase